MADNNRGLRVNGQIRVREIRLIDENGGQRGIVPTVTALRLAQEADLDLVEVAPQANPPVCKILDYGKYRFEMEKKLRDSKKKQKLQVLKEIRMQPKIDSHDLDFKSKHIREFLAGGDKVKVTVRFRGRELAHPELGKVVLDKILDALTELGVQYNLDKGALMEGKMMSMTVSPQKK